MRRIIFFILCSVLLSVFAFSTEKGPKEIKGKHFIVYYYAGSEGFANEVLTKAEEYYVSIAKDLGYERYSEFWLWDKRVKIYIYPDHESYLKASSMPYWSHGMADYRNKVIMSYLRGKGFITSILPHEMTHLMFRDFVGFTGEIPLWLDEGVAQWEEKAKRNMNYIIKDAFRKKIVLSLHDMMKMDIRNIKGDDKIYVRYTKDGDTPLILVLTGKNLINLYYVEAVSLVGFLIKKYGSKKFTSFCRELRYGKSVEAALRAVYSSYFTTLDGLEKEWKKYYLQ
ncbi:MAG: hypothetical protein B1H08_06725 [Candidatus Omnitrophica bacterium 4484_171]|nr:MAG: hypothetical protein B1H08_06725 [Candidatus Omnitrophica bacterium 4484_171]